MATRPLLTASVTTVGRAVSTPCAVLEATATTAARVVGRQNYLNGRTRRSRRRCATARIGGTMFSACARTLRVASV